MRRNYNFSKGVVIKGPIKSKSQIDRAIQEQQKTLTSIRLDNDLIEAAKLLARKEGLGYLTWINKILRQTVLNELSESSELKKRLAKLEKAVFKKKAG